jgi:phage terminase large subunit-like protein
VTFTARCQRYADQVLDGTIPACKWIKAAAQRHLDDLASPQEFYFDEAAAEQVCRFAEAMPQIKGIWARRKELVKLEDWQVFILACLFGWKRKEDGRRRFRTAYLEVARKNGKSTLLAIIALFLLTLDGEAGAEVYSAATTRDQAKIVFETAKQMALREPEFRSRFGVEVLKHTVSVEDTASKLEALSAEANTLDGLNVHGGIVDELHAHRTREVWDVLETATGSRDQSLLVAITTAGTNRAGICYEQRIYSTKLLNAVLHRHDGLGYKVEGDAAEDDTYFCAIYTIDDEDDWADESVWRKANPNWGVSVYPDDLRRKAKKAVQMASAAPNFQTKHLNVWVNADSAWMDMRAWQRQAAPEPEDLETWQCSIGVDLASKTDIAAVVRIHEKDGQFYIAGKYFAPEDTIESSPNSQYRGWASNGHLEETSGNVIDNDVILDHLKDIAARYHAAIGYDPGFGWDLIQRAQKEGLEVVEVRPTVLNFSEPMKELEKLILSGKAWHDGNPALEWMVSNVVCHRDAKDNIYPRKERDENKIDGLVATLIGLNISARHEKQESSFTLLEL